MQLVYLHGFLSSAQAFKAQQLKAYLQEQHPTIRFDCPQLPNKPAQAVPFIQQYLQSCQEQSQQLALVGSSLGGFYASYFAEQFACKAVLINPALEAANLLAINQRFENPYSGDVFQLDEKDRAVLKQLRASEASDFSRYLLLLQMADEVLDARLASAYYHRSRCIIEPQGQHQFERFERYIPLLMHWLLE